MINAINLLPFRDQQRKKSLRRLIIKLCISTLALIIIGFMYTMLQRTKISATLSEIASNKKIMVQLQTDFNQKQDAKTVLIKKIAAKNKGQKLGAWLYNIAHALPSNARLEKLSYNQKTFNISGVMTTSNAFGQYQAALAAMPGILNVVVNEIKPRPDKQNFNFILTINVVE